MSVQALSWVFEQDIPSRAKTVLLALANHADHVTGHCFPSVTTIMREASCSRQAVFNFLGLLRRNGFIEIRSVQRADGGRRSSDYWIMFDRAPAKWISSFREDNSPESEEVEDSGGEGTHSGLTENEAESPLCVRGESAVCTPIIEPSDSNRQSPEQVEGPSPRSPAPKEFSSRARLEKRERLKAAEEARRPAKVPVIQGTKPWESWVKHGHPPGLVGKIIYQGRPCRGWYFDRLYPLPAATGPPTVSELMTERDEEELEKWG